MAGEIMLFPMFRVISLEHIIEQYKNQNFLAIEEQPQAEGEVCGPNDIPCQLCQV